MALLLKEGWFLNDSRNPDSVVSFVSFLGSEGEESQESNYFEKSLRKHLIIRKKLVHVRHDVSHSI